VTSPAPSHHLPLTLAALVAFVASVTPAYLDAQTPGREPAVVEVPASTRAVGLGHAYQVGAPDPDVLFYNPAHLGSADGLLAGIHTFGGDALGLTLSAARSYFGGAVGIGVQALDLDTPGPGLRDGGLDPVVTDDDAGVSELVGTVGYARTLFGFRVGAAAKLIAQRFASARQASAAVDVGIGRRVGPVTLGLAVQNLGPDRELGAREKVQQPLRGTLSAGGYGWQLGPLDVGGAAAVSLRDDEEVVAGGGVELAYWPIRGRTFIARVGARSIPEGDAFPVTIGAGYRGDELVLDYAFQAVDDRDGIHRVTVGWR